MVVRLKANQITSTYVRCVIKNIQHLEHNSVQWLILYTTQLTLSQEIGYTTIQ